jgi:hypothetical protein
MCLAILPNANFSTAWGDCGGLHVHLLSNLLRRLIRQGTPWVRDAEGKIHVFGDRLPGPDVSIHLRMKGVTS